MEPEDFNAADWARLTKSERVAKCKRLAVQAEQIGQHRIAKQWRDLADEIQNFGRDQQPRVS